jgi:NAD(P)-dependent dehydrogenase (short-subunit alcohol dehydrogenase family)
MSEIAGRHVLITGGASGIGRLMARQLAARGARVTVWDINRDALDRVVAELGGEARVACDVSIASRSMHAAESTRRRAGRHPHQQRRHRQRGRFPRVASTPRSRRRSTSTCSPCSGRARRFCRR